MKQNILIIYILIVIINCEDVFYLSLEKLISGSSNYKLSLINKKEGISDNDLFYSGYSEFIENILVNVYNTNGKKDAIKSEKHPLVFMFDMCLFEYINYFPDDTIFITVPKCVNNKNNYSDYTFFSLLEGLEYLSNSVIMGSFYYTKIGKDIDNDMKIFFYIVLGMSILTSIFLSFIMKRVLRNMDETNLLLINFLICHISDLLLTANIGNCLSFFFFMGRESFDFLSQYLLVFLIGIYKSGFYTLGILLLQGWMISIFDDLTSRFKIYYKRLLLYELFVSLAIYFSIYLVNFTSKLNLFYIKSELEQIVFASFFVYCIFKKLIPVYKQMKYEENIRSELAECLQFKYKLLFKVYLIFGVHSLWTIISPFIEREIIYAYLYNYQLQFIFYLFYEVSFFLVINLIFIPKTLPLNYYEDIVYHYKKIVTYEANIFEEDDEDNHNKKLNISKLSSNELKKISKKENFPIVFMNPFASSKDQLVFNDIHLGMVQKHQEN